MNRSSTLAYLSKPSYLRARLLVAALAAVGLALVGAATPAAADTWRYPGGVSCTQNVATTELSARDGTGAQHRAEGYGGYYYANFSTTWYSTWSTKNWGWKDVFSSRLGTLGSGGYIASAGIFCTA